MLAVNPCVAGAAAQISPVAVDDPGRDMTLSLSATATREDARSVTELPALAQQLLAADDLEGYRRLFALAQSIEDRHRRYWASATVIESGLAAVAGAHAARLPALNMTLAACALDALECEPSEPRLLGYAGTILHELWSLDAAQAMFEAAKRLDPQLADIDRSLAAARRATARDAQLDGTRAAARGAAGALASRARDRRARPAGGRPAAEPVHDRARRAADAVALPERGRGRGRRDRRRRHRLERRDGRDRALVRGARDRARVDGLVRRGAQRVLRCGERRLGDVPGRRRAARAGGRRCCCAR